MLIEYVDSHRKIGKCYLFFDEIQILKGWQNACKTLEAFKNIDNLSQKILITTDDIDYSTSTVRHIKLRDFLLMNNLEES